MLRSLVGSEMCIRDRYQLHEDGQMQMDRGRYKQEKKHSSLVAFSHGAYSCLLYTSDAADDLLCVDLGGRRIIKKKTKKNIYRHNTT